MALLREYLRDYKKNLGDKNAVIKVIGDISVLDEDIRVLIAETEDFTKDNTGVVLNLAINYGGRDEIVHAVRKIESEGGEFTSEAMYTDPAQAKIFIESTGIDALAVSIGTSHGNYPDGMVPEFDIERLKEIKKLTGAPLVLHGGSGSGKENILNSVKYGINKINVGCDFMNANRDAAAKILKENPDINYFDLIEGTEKESKELVKYYIELSGSKGKN